MQCYMWRVALYDVSVLHYSMLYNNNCVFSLSSSWQMRQFHI